VNELTAAQCWGLLGSADVATIAVIDDDEPYATPMSFVQRDDMILFRTGPGRRLEAIRNHPRVSLNLYDVDAETGDWHSVNVWGDAEIVHDDDLEADVIAMFLDKYRPFEGPPASWGAPELIPGTAVVVRVTIDAISGRSSGSDFGPRTRPGRL
jgi:nitroimidazol reductase NimA-like FMN-containing flavoprotein (pyridoxamine 5'-phosphate oxidase superfamily)